MARGASFCAGADAACSTTDANKAAMTAQRARVECRGEFSNESTRPGYLESTRRVRAGIGRCVVMELLVLIGLVFIGVFVVGAVMLHILVGLVLLPIKLGFALFKGILFAIVAVPLAAVGLSLAVAFFSILVALGAVAFVCSVIF
jgi:hypothetical protein